MLILKIPVDTIPHVLVATTAWLVSLGLNTQNEPNYLRPCTFKAGCVPPSFPRSHTRETVSCSNILLQSLSLQQTQLGADSKITSV